MEDNFYINVLWNALIKILNESMAIFIQDYSLVIVLKILFKCYSFLFFSFACSDTLLLLIYSVLEMNNLQKNVSNIYLLKYYTQFISHRPDKFYWQTIYSYIKHT